MAARVTFAGHATVAVDIAGTRLVTDPILRSRIAFLRWKSPAQQHVEEPSADAVLVSHLHADHCDPTSLARLGHDRRLIVPAGTEQFFRRRGFTTVVGLRPGQSQTVGDARVTATAAQHDGRRLPVGPRQIALGYVVEGDGTRVYFAGDTDLFAGMRDIGTDLDVALLPVAGWGRSLGPGHLDPERAAEAVGLLRPALAVPIHWGSLQPVWDRVPRTSAPAEAFAAHVRDAGSATQVQVLAPGAALTWD